MSSTNSSQPSAAGPGDAALDYFPAPEAQAGWRWLDASGAHAVAGFDAAALGEVERQYASQFAEDSSSVVIVRGGWLVREFHSSNVPHTARFDLWSGTKSFTATAWLMALARGLRIGGDGPTVTLDTPAYELLPAGTPLSDPRKAQIRLRHLLSMTSGIAGESRGIEGMPTATDSGIYEYALGLAPNRFGQTVDKLVATPGEVWDYSDPAYAHLAMCFKALTGVDLAEFMQANVFAKIGIDASWDTQGGAGWIGPHSNSHTGLHMSARDLARFAYLIARDGRWDEARIIPAAAIAEMTTPSQPHNRAYGLGWWTNGADAYVPGLPSDLIALSGFRFNRCYIVPSLDLIVARVGTGPVVAGDHTLIKSVIAAIDGPLVPVAEWSGDLRSKHGSTQSLNER